MAPCSARGASLPPVSAAQLQRLTHTLDQIVQTLDAHISMVEAAKICFCSFNGSHNFKRSLTT